MLKKLTIKNFQPYKDVVFEFTKGINAIVGSSDGGKSAALKAVVLVTENRPLGSSFIRRGEKECHIGLETEKGNIDRYKGKDSRYEVNDNPFRAIGNDVPDAVFDVFNVGSINIQKQLDSHYLVLGSGGAIAAELNRILKINEIDDAIKYCSSEIRSKEKESGILQKQLEQKEVELERYADLEKLEKDILDLDKKEGKAAEIQDKLNDLSNTLSDILDVEDVIDAFKDPSDILLLIEELESLVDSFFIKSDKKEELNGVYCKAKGFRTRIDSYKGSEEIIILIQKLDALTNEYEEKFERHEELMENVSKIIRLNSRISKCSVDLSAIKCEEDEKKEELGELLKAIGLCPFCGKELNKDTCNKLKEAV